VSEGLLALVQDGTAKIEQWGSQRTVSQDESRLMIKSVFSKLIVMVTSSLQAIVFRAVATGASVLARLPVQGG
jgi:hypothetical protein